MKNLYPFNSEILIMYFNEVLAMPIAGFKIPSNASKELLKVVYNELRSDSKLVHMYNVLYENVIGLQRLN